MTFLAGRGFSYTIAKEVAKKLSQGSEIMDDFDE
jgi:hypothetical protein